MCITLKARKQFYFLFILDVIHKLLKWQVCVPLLYHPLGKQMLNPVPREEQTPTPAYGLGATQRESSFVKEVGCLMDRDSNMSQQCVPVAKTVNNILECIRKHASWNAASCLRGVNFLLCQVLVRPHLEWQVQFWSPENRDMNILVQWSSTKMLKGLEHLSHEERMREMGPLTQRIESSGAPS